VLIDTPGMRELRMWGDESAVADTFTDIEELATQCRFRDCKHQGEPGCAIHHAIGEGILDAGRFESYLRLQREMAHLARRQDNKARLAEKAKWKKISQLQKEFKKRR
jgi:ribosome biogenesis GTPase